MYAKFDTFGRREPLLITLCNPGSVYADGVCSNAIGMVSEAKEAELNINFNSLSTLSFRIYEQHISSDTDGDAFISNIYSKIQNRRLLFVKGYGYFSITACDIGCDDNGLSFKDVEATSCECELENKSIPYIENNSYSFNEILGSIAETIPLWTIGNVESSVGSTVRYFEDIDFSKNILSFMLEELQDAYECVFTFDTTNRVIDVTSQSSFSTLTNIHFTKDDLIKSFTISENSETLYTALSVTGGDNDISIAAINPLGTGVIYDFTYYLDWMTPALSTKVSTWQTAIENAFDDSSTNSFYSKNNTYYDLLEQKSNLQASIDAYNTIISMYQKCRNNAVAESRVVPLSEYNDIISDSNGTPIISTDNLETLLNDIDSKIASVTSDLVLAQASLININTQITSLANELDTFRNTYTIDNYFTESELTELSNYIYEGTYQDEYMVFTDTMDYQAKFDQLRTMYVRARNTLNKVSWPSREYKISFQNFLRIQDLESWSSQLEVGSTISAELETGTIVKLFLTNVTENMEDYSLSLTFGNKYSKYDTKSFFEDVLGSISKSANTLNYIKDLVYSSKSKFDEAVSAFQSMRDLSMNDALAAVNEKVTIDSSGITSREINSTTGAASPKQLKINGRQIVFTEDDWNTCATAIGELILSDGAKAYGVNAQTLIGDIILGNQLNILDDEGLDLLSAVDNKVSIRVNDIKEDIEADISDDISSSMNKIDELSNKLSMWFDFSSDGFVIKKSGGDGIYSKQTNAKYQFLQGDKVILEITPDGVTSPTFNVEEQIKFSVNSTDQWVTRAGTLVPGIGNNLNDVWIG